MQTGGPRFQKPILMPEDNGGNYAPQYAPGPDGAPAGGGFSQDPNNALALAMAARTRGEANAQATAKKKQAAIEFGEGAEGEANPFSILKNLDRGYKSGVDNLENQLNESNLFYSGYRAKQLGEAATQSQQQKYDASTRYRGLLSDVDSALAAALLNADMLEMQAGGGGGGGGGNASGDQGAGLVGRPGEQNQAGLAVIEGWNPVRNADASYDISGLQQIDTDRWVDSFGWQYDHRGKRV